MLFDKERAHVLLKIERRKFIRNNTRLFGLLPPSGQYSDSVIKSTIAIEEVEACTIRNNMASATAQITLERGILINGSRIYVCSVEEDHGKKFYEMAITVRSLNIVLSDE